MPIFSQETLSALSVVTKAVKADPSVLAEPELAFFKARRSTRSLSPARRRPACRTFFSDLTRPVCEIR